MSFIDPLGLKAMCKLFNRKIGEEYTTERQTLLGRKTYGFSLPQLLPGAPGPDDITPHPRTGRLRYGIPLDYHGDVNYKITITRMRIEEIRTQNIEYYKVCFDDCGKPISEVTVQIFPNYYGVARSWIETGFDFNANFVPDPSSFLAPTTDALPMWQR